MRTENLTTENQGNQVIIDALERYYDEMENENDAGGDEVVTVKMLEQKLIQFRQGFRDEIMQELLRVFISSMAGQQVVVPVPIEEPEPAAEGMGEKMRQGRAWQISAGCRMLWIRLWAGARIRKGW